MTERPQGRRRFLKMAAGTGLALGSGLLPKIVTEALALPARRVSGTIQDVGHVVILMQENRSFDHYFGTLRGVRGFGDPRPIPLPSGKPVWYQPKRRGTDDYVLPFRFDAASTSAQSIHSLDHSWKGSFDLWKRHDSWVPEKSALTMGYFAREDIPFYYALADAFTLCDAYHASIHGPTNPNRMYLFTGTNGLTLGEDGRQAIANPLEELNETADPGNDAKRFKGFGWPTYAERLQAAGISWRVYQEYDNYGDNALAYFASFRGIAPDSELYQRGRSWVNGSNAQNAKTSEGEHLVTAFAKDVSEDRLPQVSWIVAPFKLCEHPEAPPAYGESLVARLVSALAANPAVWSKTAFIINYDENDGFFDHMPPIQPAIDRAMGLSTVDVAGEIYKGVPVGLGIRVPMLVISPWTKGGWVNSQVFDHTSVIRFLETRFGVHEPQISPWRRTVTGDLTSVFDFDTPDTGWVPRLPDPSASVLQLEKTRQLRKPKVPAEQAMPRQEPGQRPARALPYDFVVRGAVDASGSGLRLEIANTGKAGAGFNVYSAVPGQGPWFYTIEAGKRIEDVIAFAAAHYDLSVFGPNGFLRQFGGRAPTPQFVCADVDMQFEPKTGQLALELRNNGTAPCTAVVTPTAYLKTPSASHQLLPGGTAKAFLPIAMSAYWYDVTITLVEDPQFLRRIAGHIETGAPSLSDPALG